jgi:hypothetical protein
MNLRKPFSCWRLLLLAGLNGLIDRGNGGSVRSGHGAMRPFLLLALVALLLPTAGCRTFNSTQADLERERKQLKEGYAMPGSWGSTGGMGGFRISPNIGNIGCPGLGGGVCPGK